jgi:hypothetical protein
MRIPSRYLVLLVAGVCGVAARGIAPSPILLSTTPTGVVTAEILHTAGVNSDGGDRILDPLENRGGWVNPEDLTPMPQCIYQQDQSTWLSAMTKCTAKQCTRHFGFSCTRHQWLTELVCLDTEISSDVLKVYLPYCSRAVLAKAQLYLWIRHTTGRTWLIDVGDANGLENLSPASMVKGYAALSVTYKAPVCLRDSEPFQHVIASCSFTSTAQHTGNADRPWEFRESMMALDSETVGYDLAHRTIEDGDYFDKECFCGAFTIDRNTEPCPTLRSIDMMKERLWINATCGPAGLPYNWMDMIRIPGFTYVPIEGWHWPACVADMPKQVTGLTSQCAAKACELDGSGYCKEIRDTVDRACFCHNISYDFCGGSCQSLSTRIDYVKWLYDTCGCSAFTVYPKTESCPRLRQIELMRERLWIHATCGPTALPDNWKDMVRITGPAYIPMEDWHWPRCVANMPKEVTELTSQCAADACELDGRGYCKEIKSTVDRACFCRKISYDSCGDSCKSLETRIDYVKWLHDLCGCSAFTVDPKTKTCPRPRQIELMEERLWINATCGPATLPNDWKDMVRITGPAYTPIDDWRWPACVADMPKEVTKLTGSKCASNACELDGRGYCKKIKPSVDQACFCHKISYDSCGDSCKSLETRVDYVKWLHDTCGCGAFTIDPKTKTCPRPRQIELMEERLWINATCGPTTLPDNWKDMVRITGPAYLPIDYWRWPACVADIPKEVIELPSQCATNACELDGRGYCKEIKPSVDQACFCRNISYDSCGGSCKSLETRIDYVKWLHNVCGSLQDWHGLPDNWRQLATPTASDMIPWGWTMKPFNQSNTTPNTPLGSIDASQKCASNKWKLRSFALVNIAPFLIGFLCRKTGIHGIAQRFLWQPPPWCWFFTGILIATLQLLANWVNAFLVQQTLGYENIPVFQLILFWCTLPRPSWLTIFLIGVQPFEAMNFSAAASTMFAETILQFLSSYYMIMTVNYGREHKFYLGRMEGTERETAATMMYAGALLWLIIMSLAFIQLMLATRRKIKLTGSGRVELPNWQRSKQPTSTIVDELIAQLNDYCSWFGDKLEHYWVERSLASEETSLLSDEGGNQRAYGTLPVVTPKHWASQTAFVQLYLLTVATLFLLWISQWLFWAGFIALSSEEYVFMNTLDPC